jgi:hypothetical protein
MPTPQRATRMVIAAGVVGLLLAGLLGREYWISRKPGSARSAVDPAPAPATAAPSDRASAPAAPAAAVATPAATTGAVGTLSDLDLAGDWTCTTAKDLTYAVTMQPVGSRRYRLHGAMQTQTVFAGEYEVQGDSLTMVAPANSSYCGFVWRAPGRQNEGSITLKLVSTDYAGATLTRAHPVPAF